MKQADLGFNLSTKGTRKLVPLDEMNRVVPRSALTALVEPHYPIGKTGRPPMGIETILRIHFLQQRFGLSDPAMERRTTYRYTGSSPASKSRRDACPTRARSCADLSPNLRAGVLPLKEQPECKA
jgi:hypothetical protein